MVAEVRTVSTPAAEAAVTQMGAILGGSLTDDLYALNQLALTLSDPEVWDGRTAMQFREEIWDASKAALDGLQAQLVELKSRVDIITRDIMSAG